MNRKHSSGGTESGEGEMRHEFKLKHKNFSLPSLMESIENLGVKAISFNKKKGEKTKTPMMLIDLLKSLNE